MHYYTFHFSAYFPKTFHTCSVLGHFLDPRNSICQLNWKVNGIRERKAKHRLRNIASCKMEKDIFLNILKVWFYTLDNKSFHLICPVLKSCSYTNFEPLLTLYTFQMFQESLLLQYHHHSHYYHNLKMDNEC